MASAFTIFGELKADTRAFENSLRDAEARLKATKKAIDDTEKRAEGLGKTTAVSARGFDKMRESTGKAETNLKKATEQFQKGEISAKRFEAELKRAGNAADGLGSRVKDANARLTDFASGAMTRLQDKLRSVAGGLQSAGTALTTALTVPLGGLAVAAIKSAMSIDTMLNKLKAGLGDMDKARQRLNALRDMAQKNAGVFTESAVEMDSFFRPMKVGEKTIDSLIKAFGRLKLANDNLDVKEFGRNLVQVFKTGDIQDIKQAIDSFPRFGDILQQKFGFDGSTADGIKKGLQQLQKDTNMSLSDFLANFADSVQNDPNLSRLDETISNRFQKMMERAFLALEPLGRILVDALGRVIPPLVQMIEQVTAEFNKLPAPIQDAIVGLGAFAAVVGPIAIGVALLLPVLGKVVIAIGALGTAAATAAPFLIALNEYLKRFGNLENDIAILGALNQAWQVLINTFAAAGQMINQVVNGDFAGAWSTLKNQLAQVASFNANITKAFYDTWLNLQYRMAEIGQNIIAGLIRGLNAKGAEMVATAQGWVARVKAAIAGATGFMVQSPSKFTTYVGEMLGDGLIVGMNSKTAQIVKASKDLVKKAKNAMVDEAGEWTTMRGNEIKGPFTKPSQKNPLGTAVQFEDEAAAASDASTPFGEPAAVKAKAAWTDFFDTFKARIAEMGTSLGTVKAQIGETLIDSISRIGDVFADAITNWDGTAQGFFKAIASGFARMAQQIIAELIRIAVMQAVLKLVGMFAGGGAGATASAGASTAAGVGAAGVGHFADGGYTGFGGKFDLAGLVHAREFVMPMEAVKKFGLGFMESIRNLQMPSMLPAMAGGASATSITNQNTRNVSNNFTFNMQGGASDATRQQMINAFSRAVRANDRRMK